MARSIQLGAATARASSNAPANKGPESIEVCTSTRLLQGVRARDPEARIAALRPHRRQCSVVLKRRRQCGRQTRASGAQGIPTMGPGKGARRRMCQSSVVAALICICKQAMAHSMPWAQSQEGWDSERWRRRNASWTPPGADTSHTPTRQQRPGGREPPALGDGQPPGGGRSTIPCRKRPSARCPWLYGRSWRS
jgi:hypothetical protein